MGMKWTKIDQRTGEPATRNCNSFLPHDYISGGFRIINNSFDVRKNAWILTQDGDELGRFDTLKAAKQYAESV